MHEGALRQPILEGRRDVHAAFAGFADQMGPGLGIDVEIAEDPIDVGVEELGRSRFGQAQGVGGSDDRRAVAAHGKAVERRVRPQEVRMQAAETHPREAHDGLALRSQCLGRQRPPAVVQWLGRDPFGVGVTAEQGGPGLIAHHFG